MIPSEFTDGVYLGENSTLSYRPDKYEYLINASNLARVSSVKIGDDETAVLRAVIIPKSLYDDYYRKNDEVKK